MLIHDKLIIKLFFNDNKLNRNYRIFLNKLKNNKYNNIQNYLLNRYNDLTINSKTILKESLYRILRHVENRTKCPICNKFTSFNPLRITCYNDHCSKSCEMKDKLVINKHNKTCLLKYGSKNNIQKTKQTKLEQYGNENYNNPIKRKNTNIKKYGTICPLQNNIIKEKTKQTNLIKYGYNFPQKNNKIRNKIKESNINVCKTKYNVSNIMQTDFAKEHQKTTLIKKYGVDNISKSKIIKENIEEINNKRNNTKKKNNSFNTSRPEDESYILLKSKYPDIQKQYKSNLYPFNCDFYIPSLDLYIECNYHWTHGYHHYNSNDIDDQNKLELWKSKCTKFYDNAIKTWTIRDVNKRNIAKENKLNYIEFWNINELKEWIKNKVDN